MNQITLMTSSIGNDAVDERGKIFPFIPKNDLNFPIKLLTVHVSKCSVKDSIPLEIKISLAFAIVATGTTSGNFKWK